MNNAAINNVEEYVGQDLASIGKRIDEMTTWNRVYYKLPNETIVCLRNDDEGWNDVFVIDTVNNSEHIVGGQYDNGPFNIGEFY